MRGRRDPEGENKKEKRRNAPVREKSSSEKKGHKKKQLISDIKEVHHQSESVALYQLRKRGERDHKRE